VQEYRQDGILSRDLRHPIQIRVAGSMEERLEEHSGSRQNALID
jgi:hypothetical protein